MKHLMRKCKASGEDLLLRLVNLHNTPTEGLNTSPTQRLLGRRIKSTVPTAETLLKPSYPYSYDKAQNIEDRKLKQQGTGRELSQLHIGSNVQVQPLRPHTRVWKEAKIRKKTGRLYEVENENGQRHRRSGECKEMSTLRLSNTTRIEPGFYFSVVALYCSPCWSIIPP